MDIPNSILSCLCDPSERPFNTIPRAQYTIIDEKPPIEAAPTVPISKPKVPVRKLDETAADIIGILLRAESTDKLLTQQLDDAVSATGWSEKLAEHILHALENVLKATDHDTWGEAFNDAYNCAVEIAGEIFWELVEYVKEHPVEIAASILISLFAFGILARMMPWVVRLLGFGLEGPVEGELLPICLVPEGTGLILFVTGSFAAWFQSTYRGFVPKGSIMSYLQRLGMTWGK